MHLFCGQSFKNSRRDPVSAVFSFSTFRLLFETTVVDTSVASLSVSPPVEVVCQAFTAAWAVSKVLLLDVEETRVEDGQLFREVFVHEKAVCFAFQMVPCLHQCPPTSVLERNLHQIVFPICFNASPSCSVFVVLAVSLRSCFEDVVASWFACRVHVFSSCGCHGSYCVLSCSPVYLPFRDFF